MWDDEGGTPEVGKRTLGLGRGRADVQYELVYVPHHADLDSPTLLKWLRPDTRSDSRA